MPKETSDSVAPVNYLLDPGYIFVATDPALISVVLGSCVSVCLYDRRQRIGGMNHFGFPHVRERERATAIYGNAATIMLVRMMLVRGSDRKHLEAQILGGAHNPGISSRNIGRENVIVARRILARERISLASEDVGGEKGRKVVFNTVSNEVAVIKVDKLRQGDWHPYRSSR